MASLTDIVKAGDPVLHEPAREFDPSEIGSEKIQKIIDAMVVVMGRASRVGLAAPQRRRCGAIADLNPRKRK
ncbi:hypothetical protein CRG98_040432 [Punica granatum]|uniref:Peptide deformylase n=1 Tax=Punica granatum TaxID=22663 RepID=A0A2I0I6X8_PUNGR|nr:hypothetical protein CRG98_040432 [Punica granatum]